MLALVVLSGQAPIGPTTFGILVWGSILLVLLGFVFVVWTLLIDRGVASDSSAGSE